VIDRPQVSITLTGRQMARLISATLAAAWSPGSSADLAVAACDLVAACCASSDADPAWLSSLLPYSIDLHARLETAQGLSLDPSDQESLR
jgi:hypothetical protein